MPSQLRGSAPPHPRSQPPRAAATPAPHDSIAERKLEAARQRVHDLTGQLSEARRKLEQHEREIAAHVAESAQLAARHDALQALVAVRAERIRQLESELARAKLMPSPDQERREDAHRREIEEVARRASEEREALRIEHVQQVEDMRAASRQSEATFERTVAALRVEQRRLSTPAATRADDLQAIRGIGPAYARRLASAGIVSYRQVAGWTPADLHAIAKTIGVAPARIERWAWVSEARRLLAEASHDAEDTAEDC